MSHNDNKLYTASEAADILQVHVNTIKNWHREGKIHGVQVGSGWIRIPQSEINRILNRTSLEGYEMYLRPICPTCMSDKLSWVLAAGNGLMCIDCGTTYYLTVGKSRSDLPYQDE